MTSGPMMGLFVYSTVSSFINGAIAIGEGANPAQILGAHYASMALATILPGGGTHSNLLMQIGIHAARGAIIGATNAAIMGGNIGKGAIGGGAAGGVIGLATSNQAQNLFSGNQSSTSANTPQQKIAQETDELMVSGQTQTNIDNGRAKGGPEGEKIAIEQAAKSVTRPKATDANYGVKDSGLRSPFSGRGLTGLLLMGTGSVLMIVPIPGARLVGGAMFLSGATMSGIDFWKSKKAAEDLATDTANKWLNRDKEEWEEIDKFFKEQRE